MDVIQTLFIELIFNHRDSHFAQPEDCFENLPNPIGHFQSRWSNIYICDLNIYCIYDLYISMYLM